MDAVELNYPVDVTVPKLMGPDGFGRDRVTVMEVEVVVEAEAEAETAAAESSRELCNSLLGEKEATSTATFLESTPLDKVPDSDLYRHAIPSFHSEDVSKQRHCDVANSLLPRPEEAQVQRKLGQMSRSGNGYLKRPRIALLEATTGPAAVDDTKAPFDKQGSHMTKCDSHEKAHLSRQKNNCSSKRGDRRNFKVSTKTKYDCFSMKASLASFNSAAVGNNLFGLYGLKTDVHDITKLVDDLSLNDLLQGTYECPILGKDRGKKATNTTEQILHSVRKACSILQLPRSVQSHNLAEIDTCSNEKVHTCLSSSISVVGNGDNGDLLRADLSSSHKDPCSKSKTPANLLNFSFAQPKDTLKRVALPPPKDLDSLLLDAAKPAVSSRNAPDPRPGKQTSRWPSLLPFPWSHTFSGHCRSNSDAVKLLASRSTCQGRWAKMENTFSGLEIISCCFTNLESFAYDETLVPSSGPKLAILDNNFASSTSVSRSEWGSSIAAASMTSHTHLGITCMKESGGNLKNEGKVEHCPKVLAAAQTLYEISKCTSRLNQDGMMKWPKKPSQKVMKARKSNPNEKHEVFASSSLIRDANPTSTSTSKRPKLSTSENKKDFTHINGVRKGPINWSTPKSSRSSPNKSVRESSDIVKQSCMMPPPPCKVVNRTCNGQQKVRKLMRMDWNRERDRQD